MGTSIKPNMAGYIEPDYRKRNFSTTDVAQLEVIWIIAVSLYGDYGTSPRGGWISDVSGFHEFIDAITETYRRDIGELE